MSSFPNVSEEGRKAGLTFNGRASFNSKGLSGPGLFQSASSWLHLFPVSDPRVLTPTLLLPHRLSCKVDSDSNWRTPSNIFLNVCITFAYVILSYSMCVPVWVRMRRLSRFSRVRLFVTLWTVACQAPLSIGFSRQEHWSGLPCSPPGGLSDPGIESTSLGSPALAGGFFTTLATSKAPLQCVAVLNFSFLLFLV